MAQRDYYDVLGVKKGSGEAEIKKAYKIKSHLLLGKLALPFFIR